MYFSKRKLIKQLASHLYEQIVNSENMYVGYGSVRMLPVELDGKEYVILIKKRKTFRTQYTFYIKTSEEGYHNSIAQFSGGNTIKASKKVAKKILEHLSKKEIPSYYFNFE